MKSRIFLQTVFGHLNSFQSISQLPHEYHRNLTVVVIWNGSVSNAFFKSMKTPNVYNLLSIDSLISSTRSINACEVDIDDRKPLDNACEVDIDEKGSSKQASDMLQLFLLGPFCELWVW